MPVRRRKHLRRVNDFDAWENYLECGFAFDGDLESIGLKEPPPRHLAEDAWRRHGAVLVEQWKETRRGLPERMVPWAIEQFGLPSAR